MRWMKRILIFVIFFYIIIGCNIIALQRLVIVISSINNIQNNISILVCACAGVYLYRYIIMCICV